MTKDELRKSINAHTGQSKPTGRAVNSLRKARARGTTEIPPPSIESAPILEVVEAVVPDHEEWLETPNPVLYGRKPADLIAEGDEEPIRRMLWAAVYIGVS